MAKVRNIAIIFPAQGRAIARKKLWSIIPHICNINSIENNDVVC